MPLSVSFYVRVFLTGKNKNFSSRACIYALHLLNMCKDIFEPAEKCFLQQFERSSRNDCVHEQVAKRIANVRFTNSYTKQLIMKDYNTDGQKK